MKILVLRFSSLGDIVLTEPVVRALRREYPEAELHYLTKPQYLPLVRCMPGVDRIGAWDPKDRALHKALRAERFDFLVDLSAKPRSWQVGHIVKAKRKLTYHKRHFARWRMTKHWTAESIDSVVDLYFTALEPLGITRPQEPPRLVPDPGQESFIDRVVAEAKLPLDKTLVAIFPGAAHLTKRWPVTYWRRLIETVPAAWNLHFVLMGSPEDQSDAAAISTGFDGVSNLCGRFDGGQLVGAIDRMRIVLSNDSGPMHIAAALGKQQIAVFGATHPRLGFRPLNPRATLLSQELPCRPCRLHGDESCPKKHLKCLLQVTPPHMKKALKAILEAGR
jgi:heptosyltransferase II